MKIPRIMLAAPASGSGKNADHLWFAAGIQKQRGTPGVF